MNRSLAVFAALSVLALAACSDDSDKPNAIPSFATDATATPTVAATTPGAATPPATKASTEPPKASPSKSQPSGPQIVYFRVKTKPTCSSGGPGFPATNIGVTLEWKVTGADHVTVSIDGPGEFGTYDTTFTHEFPFGCAPQGDTATHTYLLKTVGGGPVRDKTITVQARTN